MMNGDYIMVIAPPNYPGTKYRGRYCYEHYLIYWQTYGIVPKDDEIIHHKDEDKHHNVPENLELMKRKDHAKMHNHNRLSKLVLLKCPGCEKIFVREKRNTFLQKGGLFTCCCRKCIGITTGLTKTELHKRISENIIQEFQDDKSKYLL